MVQVDKKKLKVLKDIAEEVNENANKIKGIKNDALVVVSDIEGRAKDFLVKLKHTGVIDSVDVDEKTGKLKICLNKDFCGTIDFCGDLTAYKVLQPFRNEIVIEVFEELLAQIKEHNKNKEKDKQIQFVAVPGNHEFYNFWGGPDSVIMASSTDGDKGPLLIKLKSLKVIAEIQKYFLEQVCNNNDDITDNDYQYEDIDINERIELLDKECKMLDIICDVLSNAGTNLRNYFDYFLNYKQKKADLGKEKGVLKGGRFMIKTKGGKITNENCLNWDNKFCWDKNINKTELKKIFTDNVCLLPFDEILQILKSNKKYQENSGDDTEWTEELINAKLADLGKVLDNENFVLGKTTIWPSLIRSFEEMRTSIKALETKLMSFETAIQELKQELLSKDYIKQEEIEDENPISLFRPLFCDKSALLSKIVFNHHGKKFRTLHHFGLFVPEDRSVDNLTKDNQNNIFADAFSKMNQFNINALDDDKLRFLKRDIFENNKIPTLFGHEGRWSPETQTSKMYCVDTGHGDDLNVVCVVDSKNKITPYYTYKCIEFKNREQNQQNVDNLKLGDFDETAAKTLAIYDCKPQENKSGQQPPKTIVNAMLKNGEQQPAQQKNITNNLNNLKKMFEEKNICKTKLEEPKPVVHNDNNNNNDNMRIILEGKTIKNSNNENLKTLLGPNRDDLKKTIEDYVNGNTNATEQQDVAKTIALLINKDGANFLEKYSRIFAFSQKDKRAQQVYETYKNIEKNLNIITNDDAPEPQYKMYALDKVHSINTPCCSCF